MIDLYEDLDAAAKQSYSASPFVAIGGSAAVAGVVDEFYRRLAADGVLRSVSGDIITS
jgi:truncated hemoglobin YjbI